MTHFVMVSAPECVWCSKAAVLLENEGHTFEEFSSTDPSIRKLLWSIGLRTVPQIWDSSNGVRVGGFEPLASYLKHTIEKDLLD